MKKLISIIAVLTLVLSLAACGNKQPTKTDATTATQSPSASQMTENKPDATDKEDEKAPESIPEEEGYLFHVNQIEIAMNAEAAPILIALGEPKNYSEQTSCAFDGLDKTYFYGSFYLQTYPEKDQDFVYCLWFADDTVVTDEGIRIGSSQAEVEKVYGAECYNGTNAYITAKGNTELTIILKDGIVSSVQYMVLGVK